ncbi:MAG: hypothetical protein ACXAAH_18080 [Promethearchaeota archaeon]
MIKQSIDYEVVCKEILKELPEKLQEFLKDSKKILPLSHYTHERYNAKEAYRRDSVNKLAGRKYQRKKP